MSELVGKTEVGLWKQKYCYQIGYLFFLFSQGNKITCIFICVIQILTITCGLSIYSPEDVVKNTQFLNTYILYNKVNSKVASQVIKKTFPRSIGCIHHYILSNLTQQRGCLTIANLARLFSINQSELKKGFREVYKTSVRQFIIEERMKIAQKALLENKQTVSNFAALTGYADLSNFSRDFKNHTGFSPREYQIKFVE